MKVVINTCLPYDAARAHLFESLLTTSFDRWNDVIVVMGRCPASLAPALVPLTVVAAGVRSPPDAKVVLIASTFNNYDLTGLHALHEHARNPLVASDAYVYLLDTCSATESFCSFLREFRPPPIDDFILAPPHPYSNIAVFSARVVAAYGGQFGRPVSKDNGLLIEHGMPAPSDDGGTVRPLCHFGTTVPAPPRRLLGVRDPYGTGLPRHVFFYPGLGVSKYILWGKTNDLTPGEAVRAISIPWQNRRQ